MKFKNKITGKIEEADTFTKEFAFSNYEKVEEKKSPKKEEE
jgi:hypothetical protein